MKTLPQSLKKIILSMFLLSMISQIAYATTFTASASGNWSSSSTWNGGTAPSFTNTSDAIVIPSGINVTLDNNLMINGAAASLTVNGTLLTTSNYTLTDATGTITGSGAISVNSLVLQTGAFLLFDGTINTDNLNSSATSLKIVATLIVNKELTVSSGLLYLSTNGALSIGSNASLNMSGGNLANSGGTLNLSSHYNVIYSAGYTSTGSEITGTGLQSVTVDPGSGQKVVLADNLKVAGTLSLSSGTLSLGGKNLTIMGDIAAGGNGTLSSTSSSNIVINTTATPAGSLSFANNAKTVNNFTINIVSGGWATLSSSMTVNDSLVFTKGTLYISNDTLQIAATGTISGATSANYIVTNGYGFLSLHVSPKAKAAMNYPIGTASHFLPANISLDSNSDSGWVYVNVSPHVYGHGTVGGMVSATQSLVDATWNLESNINSNLNLKMQVMWNTNLEVNHFDRTKSYISHFHNSHWDTIATVSATLETNGMYAITRDTIKSLSPFAVFDDNTNAGINQSSNSDINASIEIYPNPAMDAIYVKSAAKTGKEIHAQIMNINGRIMGTYLISGYPTQIDISSWSKGMYFIKLYDNNMIETSKFVKF